MQKTPSYFLFSLACQSFTTPSWQCAINRHNQITGEPAQTEVITKQPERITLKQTENANVPVETQEITNRPLVDEAINKPTIVSKDTRPTIS
jgi:hypothetical protein